MQTIEYGLHQTPFGECFIATIQNKICQLDFIDTNFDSVFKAFSTKWNKVTIQQNQNTTYSIINQLFTNSNSLFVLLVNGTEFQLKVWAEVQKIPFGETVSYSQIAERIGKPKASRAVGTAIAKNTIAYLIPCHRVVPKAGKIGNYKWGVERKKALLEWERERYYLFKR